MADRGRRAAVVRAFAVVLLCGLSAPACSRDGVVLQVQCSFDSAAAQPCEMRDRVGADGRHDMTFESPGGSVRFVGKSQGGWWSGELDGKPAMGYERNRGRVVFSTTDLESTFEWWSEGNEHGQY